MFKRFTKSIALALVVTIVATSPVLAYLYRAPIQIVEDDGNAYDMLAWLVDCDNDWLADNGFMEADALDTRVETLGGSAKPHLVVDDQIISACAVPADSQINEYYSTGNTDLTSMDILVGYEGYFTITDGATLEPGSNFQLWFDGYVDTTNVHDAPSLVDSTNNKTAADTTHAITLPDYSAGDMLIVMICVPGGSTYGTWSDGFTELFDSYFACAYKVADGTEGATVTVVSSVNAAGHCQAFSFNHYVGVPTAGTVASGASANPDPPSLTPGYGILEKRYMTLLVAFDSVTGYPAGYTTFESRNDGSVWLDASYKESATEPDNPGTYTLNAVDSWWTNTIALAGNTGVVIWKNGAITLYVSAENHLTASIVDTVSGTVTLDVTFTPGEKDIKLYSDGSWYMLSVDSDTSWDGTNSDRVAVGGAVTGTANDWYLMMGNSLIYTDFYKHTVGGTLIAHYQPIAIIVGTTLPDREGAAENGAFTWGSNPAGITVTLGGLVSSGQPSIGVTEEDDEPNDIIPTGETSDWFGDGTVSGATLTNPLRPFITMISDNTTLDEIQVWRWMGVALLLFVTVGAAVLLRGHQGITAIIASVALGGLVAFDHNIFPFWLLVIAIGCFIGGLVAERSPSL